MMQKTMLWMMLFTCFTNVLSAQETVSGKIMAFKGYGLKGVEVKAKRSGHSTLTDSLGNFRLEVNRADMIKVKAKGFQPTQRKYHGQESLAVNMIYMDNEWAYNQIIENAYMNKENLDYCIDNLLTSNNNYDRMADIFQVIQSEYPQAKVADLRGQKRVFLNSRGPQSIDSDTDALILVDGIVTQNISGIPPNKVEKVNVLVGNEAAYYGTRGGNGVIEITLKKD